MSAFMGYLMPKELFLKNCSFTRTIGISYYLCAISPKLNVIAQREFDLTYFNVAAQLVCH